MSNRDKIKTTVYNTSYICIMVENKDCSSNKLDGETSFWILSAKYKNKSLIDRYLNLK